MSNSINIIDIFSGPGGLGEGFSSYSVRKAKKDIHPFSIAMSVEMEASAHRTLQLRSFFRKFPDGAAPVEYYQYIRNPDECPREELFDLYPEQAAEAIRETLAKPRALGTDDDKHVFKELGALKNTHQGLWVVIGGPPCQAYSLVGRSRNAGTSGYRAEKDHRHFLYKEYLKVLDKIKPEIFIMENVKGILSSSVQGQKVFPQLLSDLRNPGKALNKRSSTGYRVYSLVSEPDDLDLIDDPVYQSGSDFIIRSEHYGIPQMRHRVILIGVRADIEASPDVLTQSPQVGLDKIIGGMPPLRSGLSKEPDGEYEWQAAMQSITKELAKELRTGRNHNIASAIREMTIEAASLGGRGGRFVKSASSGFARGYRGTLRKWIQDPSLKGFPNHETRGHIRGDLMRYIWCATFTANIDRDKHPSPKAHEFPDFLAPNHRNWKSGHFTDRFRAQTKGSPATTITSHISKDGHYFIHYDPLQCRSLTVREAARIQTFPDNYFFEGNRTQQYVQVGNAVPPFLARQIADIVYKITTQI